MDESTSSPAYRRGLVLGLTLAEIFLLLLFLLLLLSIFLIDQERKATEDIHKIIAKEKILGPTELREELVQLVQMRDALEAAGLPIDDPNELTTRLISASSAEALAKKYRDTCGDLEQIKKVMSRLQKPDETAEDALRLCAEILTPEGGTEGIESVEQARIVIDRLRRQMRSVQAQLEAVAGGRGLVYPSCWTPADNPNGQVFIYDVDVLDDGLRVAMGDAREGQDLSALKQNGREPDFGRILPVDEFLERTRGLYDWSLREKCRFFVRLSDKTSATNKAGYKLMRATVERHFYIRITS